MPLAPRSPSVVLSRTPTWAVPSQAPPWFCLSETAGLCPGPGSHESLQALCYFSSLAYNARSLTTDKKRWHQLWFPAAASRSVISDPNIATKKPHSWVKRENRRTGGENFSFPNSTALRGLPLVGDAGHGRQDPAGTVPPWEEGQGAERSHPRGVESDASHSGQRTASAGRAGLRPSAINQGKVLGRRSPPCLEVSESR